MEGRGHLHIRMSLKTGLYRRSLSATMRMILNYNRTDTCKILAQINLLVVEWFCWLNYLEVNKMTVLEYLIDELDLALELLIDELDDSELDDSELDDSELDDNEFKDFAVKYLHK